MPQFPSYVEHDGYYNIPDDDGPRTGLMNTSGKLSCWRSTPDLPPLSWHEFGSIRAEVQEVLRKHGRLPGMTIEQAKMLYEYCVGDELTDRTIRLEIPEITVVTVDFLRALQAGVLSKHALWRILIVAESPETVVIVYPQTVRLGRETSGADWTTRLERVIAAEKALRKAREAPTRRQLVYLRYQVQKRIKNAKTTPFQVVAVFDNWRGEFDNWCIWLLHEGQSWADYGIEKPSSVSSGKHYAVHGPGFFGEEYPYNESNLWLTEWIIPAEEPFEITVQRIEHGLAVGPKWSLEVSKDLVKDEGLRKILGVR